MGSRTTASEEYSTAAGHFVKAKHKGTFAWGDSQNTEFAATANDQFLIRAAGGVGIGPNDPRNYRLRVEGNFHYSNIRSPATDYAEYF